MVVVDRCDYFRDCDRDTWVVVVVLLDADDDCQRRRGQRESRPAADDDDETDTDDNPRNDGSHWEMDRPGTRHFERQVRLEKD